MNRREFTTSLAALATTPALPFPMAAPRAAAQFPPGAYAWGRLIARAQNNCSPATLARHLQLGNDAAHALFNRMLADGVLQAPNIAGVARAAQPIDAAGSRHQLGDHLRRKAKTLLEAPLEQEERSDDAGPLVNHDS